MALMRYQPLASRFGGLSQLHHEINRLFDSLGFDDDMMTAATDWTPAVDVVEEQDRYVLHADVPGVDPKDIEITLEDGGLTLRGQREASNTEEGKAVRRPPRSIRMYILRGGLP